MKTISSCPMYGDGPGRFIKEKKDKSIRESGRYIDDFIKLKCAPDLLAAKVFPNAKEITESQAMYFGVVNHICIPEGIKRDNPNVTVYVVGDGKHPRTGMMFAYRSAWNVISIDPTMDGKWLMQKEVDRLKCYRFKVESLLFMHLDTEHVIVVLPHSHAKMNDILVSIVAKNLHIISMPCCVPHNIPGIEPAYEYDDTRVWSPQNTVKVWTDVTSKMEI